MDVRPFTLLRLASENWRPMVRCKSSAAHFTRRDYRRIAISLRRKQVNRRSWRCRGHLWLQQRPRVATPKCFRAIIELEAVITGKPEPPESYPSSITLCETYSCNR